MPRVYKRLSLAERFWPKVQKSDAGCWLWTGARIKRGASYGVIGIDRRRLALAHRVSWELHNGPIPSGSWVLHKCDVRACVRPDHLFLGDRKANIDDMVQKGRSQHGDRTHFAKLHPVDVKRIRSSVRAGEMTYAQAAAHYGITSGNVYYIVSGKTWKHVD